MYKILNDIENNLAHFQIYSEVEVACKYPKPFFQKKISETLVDYKKGFDMKTGKLILDMTHPYQNREDKKSYIPVKA